MDSEDLNVIGIVMTRKIMICQAPNPPTWCTRMSSKLWMVFGMLDSFYGTVEHNNTSGKFYQRVTIVGYATRVIILWLEVTKFNYWKYAVDVMVFAPYSYFYSLDIYFHLKHNKVQLKLINASMNTTTPQQHNKPYRKLYWAKKLRKIRNLTRCKSQPAKKLSKISLKIRLGVFFLTAVDKMTWEHKSFRRFRFNSDVLKTTQKKTFFSLSVLFTFNFQRRTSFSFFRWHFEISLRQRLNV